MQMTGVVFRTTFPCLRREDRRQFQNNLEHVRRCWSYDGDVKKEKTVG